MVWFLNTIKHTVITASSVYVWCLSQLLTPPPKDAYLCYKLYGHANANQDQPLIMGLLLN